MAKILVVDDDKSIRRTLMDILEFEKYEVVEACDGLDCMVKLRQNKFDVVILDVKMPKMDGMEVMEKIQVTKPELPVVMISGHGNIDTAVDAVKKGAFDFIQKPPDLNRLLITIRNAMDKSTLITDKKILQKKVNRKSLASEIVGESQEIQAIKDTIDVVGPTDARILISGDNGTGKELVVRWIHEKSSRSKESLVEVNCAAIPSELIESELFGHEKGSFTSAYKQRIGKFELADKGTLFLDEVGDMSLSAQAKVLRALQESRIVRVGGDKEISVDVRVIAATNKDLRAEISKGKFREDLYHRLAVILIKVPNLSERINDIPLLAHHFNKMICLEYGIQEKSIQPSAIKELQKLPWTGNIRELRNVMERLVILSDEEITKDHVKVFVKGDGKVKTELQELYDKFDSLEQLQYYIRDEYSKYKEIYM